MGCVISNDKYPKINEDANSEPQILNQIRDIKFNKLGRLSLFRNEVQSIQGINRIYMPQLNFLHLGFNKIVKVKNLTKANIPNLSQLCLQSNCIVDMECLVKLQNKTIQHFQLMFIKSNFDCVNFIIKLRAQTAKYISKGCYIDRLPQPGQDPKPIINQKNKGQIWD